MTRNEILAIAKPILFNTEMVRTILDGRKTVTRRAIKKKFENTVIYIENDRVLESLVKSKNYGVYEICPKYKVGNYLYVRETFCYDDVDNGGETIYYRADYTEREAKEFFKNCDLPWHPSIHMPKETARIFLRVTNVRVERLQDISNKEAKKEGVTCETDNSGLMHRAKFRTLWNSTIKKQDLDKYGWDANPWVWVYEFERVKVHE